MIDPYTDPRRPAPGAPPAPPPDERDELLVRLQIAARKVHLDELAAVVWIAEQLAADGLDADRFRDRKGGGFDVRDLEALATVTARKALTAVLSLLGKVPPIKGMPDRGAR